MAVLNDWQKLTRVLPGRPFGDYIHGDFSSATVPSITRRSCSGSASSTTLTIGSSGFSNGDVVIIYQTRGTGATQWEVNKISSGGGTTTLTLQRSLHYTFTDSGASQAQVIELKRYKDITVASGTWTLTAWDGDTGGLLPIAGKSITYTGTIVGDGANGTDISDGGEPGNQAGFRGGNAKENGVAGQGEGTSGARDTASTSANGNGGGGGNGGSGNNGGGGGGGNGAAGTNGSGTGGTGGSTAGAADLTTFALGGGGGGGGGGAGTEQGSGANGGAGLMLFVKTINTPNSISLTGGNGGSNGGGGDPQGGGGGAGGSCLLVCQTATLGTNKIVATGGSGTSGGGGGGTGRIAVHHSGTVSGTTSPSFTDVTDGSLIESDGGFLLSLV